MDSLPFTEEELIHAELEALKNSVVMLKISERGKIVTRILVQKEDIEHFKKLGYAENIKEDYDPQIGHLIEPKHIDIPKEHINFLEGLKEERKLLDKKLTKDLKFFKKILYYIKKLFRRK